VTIPFVARPSFCAWYSRSVPVVLLPELFGSTRGPVPGANVVEAPGDLGAGVLMPVASGFAEFFGGEGLWDSVGPGCGVLGVPPPT
jgi:hypothetical protein